MKKKQVNELEYLGREVKVIIDRPLWSKHPKFEMNYTLNYGFIPNTIGGDGKEIDVYVIGEDQPIKEYTGIVKAIIIRHNDVENKLVVVKKDYDLTAKEIEEKTFFQERYFDIKIKLASDGRDNRFKSRDI